MRNILLPTDFSENAWNAIAYALKLLKDETCTFFILNSYSPPMSGPYSGLVSRMARESIYKAQVENSKMGLNEVLKNIDLHYKNENHKFVTLDVYDSFSSAVKKVVEEKAIDCIIMGTKGASGLKEMTVGSNTAGLIGVAQCPILVIPRGAEFKTSDEIGLSTDYDVPFTVKGLKPLLEIAQGHDSKISVLHVMDQQRKLTKRQKEKFEYLKEILKDYNAEYYTLTDIGVSSGVRAFAQSRKLGMFCVVAKEQDFLKRMLNQSYSKSISNQSEIPLLILNVNCF